jgi:hypothetical protein
VARAESEAAGRPSAVGNDESTDVDADEGRGRRVRLIGSFMAGLALPVVFLGSVALVAWQRSWAESPSPSPAALAAGVPVGEPSLRPRVAAPVEMVTRELPQRPIDAPSAATTAAGAEAREATPVEPEPPSLPPRPTMVPRVHEIPSLPPMRKVSLPEAPRASVELWGTAPRGRGRDRDALESSDIVDWFIREYPRRLEAGGL